MNKKQRHIELLQASTKPDIARLLDVSASFLTRVLYHPGTNAHYHTFDIQKKSGGKRTISAPSDELKDLQRRLADLLQDCKEVISKERGVTCQLSHGFEKHKSILTNAKVHRNKKCVLNIDIRDFFDSFNFGRVRGFFIANNDFNLHPAVATVLAQIACYNNKLPQGSPCSPVITNLITNNLDIRLSKLAKKCGATYSRYADDLTFSTRKKEFPSQIIKNVTPLTLGNKLLREIQRSGFSINNKKTRLQLDNSRQETTGLIVNKKINTKSEYWREARAMAHSIFTKGSFTIKNSDGTERNGTLNELEGRLTFIDHIDHYNNLKNDRSPIPRYELKKATGIDSFRKKLNIREVTYSRFLFYKYFFNSPYPTILTEGKTDNVYLKSALNSLQSNYPNLINPKTKDTQYSPKLSFPNLNSKTMYFLDIGDGATPFLRFIQRYIDDINFYKNQIPQNPVILILDNDEGPIAIINHLANKIKSCPNTKKEIKESGFLHLFSNLYLILTPLKSGMDSMMEDLFDEKTLQEKIDGKSFSTKSSFDERFFYGKHIFSTRVIQERKGNINFQKFSEIFDEIEKVKSHFKTLNLKPVTK